jgi:hypothetical protein
MRRIRVALEPSLSAAGFEFDARHNSPRGRTSWFDFTRGDLILRCSLDCRNGALLAETLDDRADYQQVAAVELRDPTTTHALLERMETFVAAVRRFLEEPTN